VQILLNFITKEAPITACLLRGASTVPSLTPFTTISNIKGSATDHKQWKILLHIYPS